MYRRSLLLISTCISIFFPTGIIFAQNTTEWEQLPNIPNQLGVAGPITGIHNGALIVAGGANFPKPIWETDKQWHKDVFILLLDAEEPQWRKAAELPFAIGYSACTITPHGIIAVGGNDSSRTFDSTMLIQWDTEQSSILIHQLPPLPTPIVYAQAAYAGNSVYLFGGQTGPALGTATNNVWQLNLKSFGTGKPLIWRQLKTPPWNSRAFNVVATHSGHGRQRIFMMSGRRESTGEPEFLTDMWEFNPRRHSWKQLADLPRCVMAGTAIGIAENRLLVLGGADGSLFDKADELKDKHPGFPRSAIVYDFASDRWSNAGAMPTNQVTTSALEWNGDVILPTGEIRPRVRTPIVWRVKVK